MYTVRLRWMLDVMKGGVGSGEYGTQFPFDMESICNNELYFVGIP